MKQLVIILFSLALLCSCKKDNLSKLQKQFAGQWEQVSAINYLATVPAPKGRIIILREDGSFERRNSDTIVFKGLYSLEERKDCYGEDKVVFFKSTDASFANNYRISIKGDSLSISTPNCYMDGGISIYKRK